MQDNSVDREKLPRVLDLHHFQGVNATNLPSYQKANSARSFFPAATLEVNQVDSGSSLCAGLTRIYWNLLGKHELKLIDRYREARGMLEER
jgi:hypothetical protein